MGASFLFINVNRRNNSGKAYIINLNPQKVYTEVKNLKKETNNILVYPNRKEEYMQIKLYSPAEAFAAMAILVMHTDGKTSVKELNIILKNFSSQPLGVLSFIDSSDLFNLFLETKGKILKLFNRIPDKDDLLVFNKQEVENIINASKNVLSTGLRETAFFLAVELAYADGMSEPEKSILGKIKDEFEINNSIADMIMEIVPIKYRIPKLFEKDASQKSLCKLQNAEEAIIAIQLAIIFADEDVRIKQTANMFWNLTLLNIFKNKSPEYYYETKYKVLNIFGKHLDQPIPFNDTEINNLISECKNIMEPEIRETALWVATELAYTTGMNEYEIKLLEKYIQGMDIDLNIAEKISQVIPIKFRT